MKLSNKDLSKHLRRRPRRLRKTEAIRKMVSETRLLPENLVLPLFITEGDDKKEPISSMPGVYRLGMNEALRLAETACELGVSGIALFPHITEDKKDPLAKESLNQSGFLPKSIEKFKKELPDLVVITDVALDPYSTDGHDGIVKDNKILNDETLEILAQMSLVQAQAGADFVAPSDMMDGRVGVIRDRLDDNGFSEVGIISYAAKYASSFYGPFREALDSAPKSGDKKTYQMHPGNVREALLEAELDIEQGADIVMVKPALSYLDVISKIRQSFNIPIAAYNVSGEYAMIKFAAQNKAFDEEKAMFEMLLSIKRAGADLIFTYFAIAAAKYIKKMS